MNVALLRLKQNKKQTVLEISNNCIILLKFCAVQKRKPFDIRDNRWSVALFDDFFLFESGREEGQEIVTFSHEFLLTVRRKRSFFSIFNDKF